MSTGKAGAKLVPFGGEPPRAGSPATIAFYHVPKCGGTTLTDLLAASWPSSGLLRAPLQELREIRGAQGLCFVHGHFVWGLHELLPADRPFYYLTLLREPFARCLSSYRYSKRELMHDQPLEEWLERYEHDVFVRSLAGGDLALAKHRLEREVYLFGLLERFDDFHGALRARLRGVPPRYVRKNVSRSAEDSLPIAMQRKFEEHNALDLELYAWAEELFDRRMRAEGRARVRRTAPAASQAMRTPSPRVERAVSAGGASDVASLIADASDPIEALPVVSRLTKTGRTQEAARLLARLRGAYGRIHPLLYAYYDAIDPREAIPALSEELAWLDHLPPTRYPSGTNAWKRDCASFLGWIHEGCGELERAEVRLREAAAVDPRHFGAVRELAAFLGRRSRPEEACALLCSVDRSRADDADFEAALAGALMPMSRSGATSHAYAAALRRFPAAQRAVRAYMSARLGRPVPLAEALGSRRVEVLVIRTAPLALLDAIGEPLRQLDARVSVLSRADSRADVSARAWVHRFHELPNRAFDFERDRSALGAELRAAQLDAVIVLLSHFDLDYYRDVLRLAEQLCSRRTLLFFGEQTHDPDWSQRVFLPSWPDSRGRREAIAGTSPFLSGP